MYDIVLLERPYGLASRDFGPGLTKEDVIKLFDILGEQEAYPIEIFAREHECSAMGFISATAAHKINYEYMTINQPGGLCEFVARILDGMENESKTHEYEFKGLKIWLGR